MRLPCSCHSKTEYLVEWCPRLLNTHLPIARLPTYRSHRCRALRWLQPSQFLCLKVRGSPNLRAIDARELGEAVAPLEISGTSRGFVATILISRFVHKCQDHLVGFFKFFLPAVEPEEIRRSEDVVFLSVFLDRTVDIIDGTLISVVCVSIVVAH